MKIEVTNLDGNPVDLAKAALNAVGKAFLLPLDMYPEPYILLGKGL